MEQKTIGIVLQCIKYNESATIAHFYTKKEGRTAFIVYRGRGKGSAVKMAYLQPLFILELDALSTKSKSIPKLKEMRPTNPLGDLIGNPIKSIIALFLSEVLSNVLKEPQEDLPLFDFLENSIHVLNLIDKGVANFHLAFLIQLTRFLGYAPNEEGLDNCNFKFFDLQNGVFTTSPPLHSSYLNEEETSLFKKMTRINYENMHLFHFSRNERIRVIHSILQYYKLHHANFHEIRSLNVMQEIFE